MNKTWRWCINDELKIWLQIHAFQIKEIIDFTHFCVPGAWRCRGGHLFGHLWIRTLLQDWHRHCAWGQVGIWRDNKIVTFRLELQNLTSNGSLSFNIGRGIVLQICTWTVCRLKLLSQHTFTVCLGRTGWLYLHSDYTLTWIGSQVSKYFHTFLDRWRKNKID